MTEQPMGMVERVARTLEPRAWAALGVADTLAYRNRRVSSLRKARSAIAAMREPSDEMIIAIRDALPSFVMIETARRVCDAMIDAALGEEG